MKNRSLVFETSQEYVAHLMKDKLESEGINTLILNQQDSMYKTFGSFELYVITEEENRAKEIIALNQEN